MLSVGYNRIQLPEEQIASIRVPSSESYIFINKVYPKICEHSLNFSLFIFPKL